MLNFLTNFKKEEFLKICLFVLANLRRLKMDLHFFPPKKHLNFKNISKSTLLLLPYIHQYINMHCLRNRIVLFEVGFTFVHAKSLKPSPSTPESNDQSVR